MMTRRIVQMALTVTLVGAAVAVAAQKPDRSTPPKPGSPPALKLPPIQKQKLSNGLSVWFIEQHEVPLAQINLIVRAGSGADPVGGGGATCAAVARAGRGDRLAAVRAGRQRHPGHDAMAGVGMTQGMEAAGLDPRGLAGREQRPRLM